MRSSTQLASLLFMTAASMWSQQTGPLAKVEQPTQPPELITSAEHTEDAIVVSPSLYAVCMQRCEMFQDPCFESGQTKAQCAALYLDCIRRCDQYRHTGRPPVQSIPPVVGAASHPNIPIRCASVQVSGHRTTIH